MNDAICLVTGGNGFLGSAVVGEFTRQNIPVRAAVRNTSKRVRKANEVEVGEINESTDWSTALIGVNVIVHTAGRVHVIKGAVANPIDEYRLVNTRGTLNLAKQAMSAGVKRFIFISTVKVNGESTQVGRPFTADDTPNPTDPYSISKFEAEQQLLSLVDNSHMDVVIIRPPLIYGRGVKANFAMLLAATKSCVPLPFRSVQYNRRSLVSVDNLTDLIVKCLTHKNASNQVFLVSDDHDVSTSELIALMSKVNHRINFAFPMPLFVFEILGRLFNKNEMISRLIGSLQVDISKTKKMLGWRPPCSLDDGLSRSIIEKGATSNDQMY